MKKSDFIVLLILIGMGLLAIVSVANNVRYSNDNGVSLPPRTDYVLRQPQ